MRLSSSFSLVPSISTPSSTKPKLGATQSTLDVMVFTLKVEDKKKEDEGG